MDTFPIPQEFTFDKEGTTLDKYTIKTLTRLVYRKTKRKSPNAIKKWNKNSRISSILRPGSTGSS
jgi:hypothetical protein